jgi:hypothetical protein
VALGGAWLDGSIIDAAQLDLFTCQGHPDKDPVWAGMPQLMPVSAGSTDRRARQEKKWPGVRLLYDHRSSGKSPL